MSNLIDPQLEKEVEPALTLLNENPAKLLNEPAPPVSTLRPKEKLI